ncbi:hypothetical protein C7437_102283 [Psychrobacillus insolitus]|uniref:Uncharacterized protein n=1 Tax=Psychrobacillus insolitus TaxID=1461 RepID=A0A2W7PDT8_9BACI|nr:hypothetical protein C7437_102283 [Psychrobacillus insolitus]
MKTGYTSSVSTHTISTKISNNRTSQYTIDFLIYLNYYVLAFYIYA